MAEQQTSHVGILVDDQKVVAQKRTPQSKHGPSAEFHCYNLFLIFRKFRELNQHRELIEFLVKNYPQNVKNKTFNFVNTNHLFHSLYAYIPAITNVDKERKQIRLSEECIQKLFVNTINDFKLYTELFDMIRANDMREQCPCQLLLQRRQEIKSYVDTINEKEFDNKPPKLKKEIIDNIMYKYSLNWKNLLLKRKTVDAMVVGKTVKKKRKLKKKTILTDELIHVTCIGDGGGGNKKKLHDINGMSLTTCKHEWTTLERQLRAGDEAVSFIKLCRLCAQVDSQNRLNN
ncbi:Late expression factor 5 [Trabala vishnou gigantina nucleopolyhedrovirus]|uniref:Late expression factor 5 n=1 Tax=Trabala vishnou gigantina nucleopolyhedrovirus TaxID=2863583 RepID=UPI002481ADE4|nr:Late expression factor 5 [Trabala vishnou gigantina nucleopolyhedrovirus]QYC92711.1 Late expression factor 5 [Trabala vishnou gigantina nucleopolyhedrovirus]